MIVQSDNLHQFPDLKIFSFSADFSFFCCSNLRTSFYFQPNFSYFTLISSCFSAFLSIFSVFDKRSFSCPNFTVLHIALITLRHLRTYTCRFTSCGTACKNKRTAHSLTFAHLQPCQTLIRDGCVFTSDIIYVVCIVTTYIISHLPCFIYLFFANQVSVITVYEVAISL